MNSNDVNFQIHALAEKLKALQSVHGEMQTEIVRLEQQLRALKTRVGAAHQQEIRNKPIPAN